MVLVVLVLAWAVFLIPLWLRRRAERHPSVSVADSLRRLSTVHASRSAAAGTNPSIGRRVPLALVHSDASMARARARKARKRRRDVFMGLLASVIGSCLISFFVPQVWLLHVVLDVLLVGYVLALVRLRHSGRAIEAPAFPPVPAYVFSGD